MKWYKFLFAGAVTIITFLYSIFGIGGAFRSTRASSKPVDDVKTRTL